MNFENQVLIDESKLCRNCVMPEVKPHITFDEHGVCSVCREFEKNKHKEIESQPLETEFIKILKQNKSKGKYDCLVMCSGGKDSTSSLYYMKERYKLNPLAYSFDHGFETDDAMNNVKKAVEKLGIDYLFFKSSFMDDMFGKILKTNSKAVICHLCSIWYMQLTFDLAARFEIPLIIAGWTKGQSTKQPVMSKCACNISAPEYMAMGEETVKFIDEHVKTDPKYKDFPYSMAELITKAKKRFKSLVVSPHWFLPYDADEYVELIKRELNWEYPKLSYPAKTTNCLLNYISVYNSLRYYGYTHYQVEMSKLIRMGKLLRSEALEDLKIDFDKDLLNKIAGNLDYKF
jgi:predicted PP-loop superfamily ATPase